MSLGRDCVLLGEEQGLTEVGWSCGHWHVLYILSLWGSGEGSSKEGEAQQAGRLQEIKQDSK